MLVVIGYLGYVLILLFAFSGYVVDGLPFLKVDDWFSLIISLASMTVVAAIIFIVHHITLFYLFPKLIITEEEGNLVLKEVRGNRTFQEIPRQMISKIHLIYQATSFYIAIHTRVGAEEKRYKYEIADGYVLALFFKKRIGKKHKRNMKNIFKGIKLYEYKKGGIFRRF